MRKKILFLTRKIFFSILLMLSVFFLFDGAKVQAASNKVNTVVENARDNYYTTNNKISNKKYKVTTVKGKYKYWKDGNGKIRKIVVYPQYKDMAVNKCTAEYYFNSNQKLVFAFAYKKVNGKTSEYRCYYGTDKKCYRYINPSGKIYNYKNGKATTGTTIKDNLYKKGTAMLNKVAKKMPDAKQKKIVNTADWFIFHKLFAAYYEGGVSNVYSGTLKAKDKAVIAASTLPYNAYNWTPVYGDPAEIGDVSVATVKNKYKQIFGSKPESLKLPVASDKFDMYSYYCDFALNKNKNKVLRWSVDYENDYSSSFTGIKNNGNGKFTVTKKYKYYYHWGQKQDGKAPSLTATVKVQIKKNANSPYGYNIIGITMK